VVLPHGGPHARDTWTYDADVQFLANRGYAVLQPNFRGSTGYGKEFLEKGYGQWGGAMQNDINDGVAWLVEQGIVDAKRVCIMGVSYGGYAALIGAITSPDIYRCAISYAGVTDVKAWMKSHRYDMLPKRYRKWRQRVLGEADSSSGSPSPIDFAERVSIPVLLGHGTKDDRVPFRQAEKMARALRRANKDVEYLTFKDAGHGYEGDDHVRFLNAVEAFLSKHNPADL
jgi:dipeptidyl aminopeptidase/acylaminoacyl peptidase